MAHLQPVGGCLQSRVQIYSEGHFQEASDAERANVQHSKSDIFLTKSAIVALSP